MKIQDLPRTINADDELVVCFDVSKKKLDGYAIHTRREAPDREITVTIERRTDQIEEQLSELADYAEREDLSGLCVICEPTGGYDQELLRLARKQGHRTAYVNTEHSKKMSSVDPDGCRGPTRRIRPTPGRCPWSHRLTGRRPTERWRKSTVCSASWVRCTRTRTGRLSRPERVSTMC